ncbi:PH domain-containing protein [Rhodohalobacter sp. SW132]|uniref:PH domain-containing protein n=1 Tax=Rhodohalobacter sp. SW132 TaxID=2293433 RepID=UPI000E23D414|nr:PH domain-containing protein [Rhodohalobacter sp. SW132]REL33709.1 PH domain-containing protein [Rhodohalobacter sp. SW132]
MSKSIDLKPDWKRWFWGYFFGVLLIPLFGIGIIVLWKVHQKKKSYRYTVTDRQITAIGEGVSQTVDLINIKNLDVEQNWVDQKFGIGDIVLNTGSRTITLLGQNNPEAISDSISKAIYAEKKRIESLNKVEEKKIEPPPPGTLDKLDYLTGLWQQGLLSDEDFKKEKKNFEK